MRIIKIVFSVLFATFFGLWWVTPAKAECTGCQVCSEPSCVENPTPDGPVLVCTDIWVTGSGCGQTNGGCPSGSYNTPSGECRAIGTGTPVGGGGTSECGGSLVNCSAGYVKSLPVQNVFCVGDYGGYSEAFCGRGPGTAQEVTGCCGNTHIDEEGNEVCNRGNDQITTYTCVPICTASAPSAPTLTYPSNASSQSSTTASLMWNQVSWGTACSGASNQYYVYLGTTNPPNYFTTVASNVTSLNAGNLTRGATYYWQIVASNGQLYTNSAVRSFTILNNQIAGKVFYDTSNSCSQATPWSSGGVAISLNGGAGNAISEAGTFTLSEPLSGPHTLAVSIPAGYVCGGAASCKMYFRPSL